MRPMTFALLIALAGACIWWQQANDPVLWLCMGYLLGTLTALPLTSQFSEKENP